MKSVIWLLCVAAVSMSATSNALETRLETDCSQSATGTTSHENASSSPSSTVESAFRLDNVTEDECSKYAAMRRKTGSGWPRDTCSPNMPDRCSEPIGENFLVLGCRAGTLDRSEMAEVAKNISIISPRRAVAIHIERVETYSGPSPDLLHSDIVEPFRNQVIEIKLQGCVGYADDVTAKIYEMGILPNLLRFGAFSCRGLKLRRKDFSRMPHVRMIYFELSTFEHIEPYTFTDLKDLQLLVLEAGAYSAVNQLEGYRNIGRLDRAPLHPRDIERVRKLHCDCSLAWFRNYLKQKPSLVRTKQPGEVYRVGSYISPQVRIQNASVNPDVLSVDCAQPLTIENIRHADRSQYSHNTECFNLKC